MDCPAFTPLHCTALHMLQKPGSQPIGRDSAVLGGRKKKILGDGFLHGERGAARKATFCSCPVSTRMKHCFGKREILKTRREMIDSNYASGTRSGRVAFKHWKIVAV